MESTVQKWGNSLGVRIPKIFANHLALEDGSLIKLFKRKIGLLFILISKNH
jgi:antitoxin MazE